MLWLTYATLYLGRQNIAIALPVIQQDLGWTSSMAGIVTGCFFWLYAVGQLINGQLGDRLNCRTIVLCGLLGSALLNITFGLTTLFPFMVALWGINGYIQSTGWGPIVKIASNWTSPEERGKVAGMLGTSVIAGFFLSWFISSRLLLCGTWRHVFILPALLLLVVSIAWQLRVCIKPKLAGLSRPGHEVETIHQHPHPDPVHQQTRPAWLFIAHPAMFQLALVSLLQGMVKDGITLWAPTLLVYSRQFPLEKATTLSLLIPLFGLAGILLTSHLNTKSNGNDKAVICFLLTIAGIIALVAAGALQQGHGFIMVFAVASCSALVYGANTDLLTSIPLRFTRSGRQSSVAGFLDSTSYLGAALMSIATGILVGHWGWLQIIVLWAVICLAAGVCMALVPLDDIIDKERPRQISC